MIVVTGAAGFIGSQAALMAGRNDEVVCIDHSPLFENRHYLTSSQFKFEDANVEFSSVMSKYPKPAWVIHMGAISATDVRDPLMLKKWNVDYSKAVWTYCTENKVPLIYASSAATYGDGGNGFKDDIETILKLSPLNPYGQSKHEFDLFVLREKSAPPSWYGLKFFNVYGPHEDHKARQASVCWHGYHEITQSGRLTLFKSHNPKFKDGEQARDFVYVKECLRQMEFLISKRPKSGIYNCGSGEASTFLQLGQCLFKATGKHEQIDFVPTPEAFRSAYQYWTQADMSRVYDLGYKKTDLKMQDFVSDYVLYLNSRR